MATAKKITRALVSLMFLGLGCLPLAGCKPAPETAAKALSEDEVRIAVYVEEFQNQSLKSNASWSYYFLHENSAVIEKVNATFRNQLRQPGALQIVSADQCRQQLGGRVYSTVDGRTGREYWTEVTSLTAERATVSFGWYYASLASAGFKVELRRSPADGKWRVVSKTLGYIS